MDPVNNPEVKKIKKNAKLVLIGCSIFCYLMAMVCGMVGGALCAWDHPIYSALFVLIAFLYANTGKDAYVQSSKF